MKFNTILSLTAAALVGATLAVGGWVVQTDERALLSDAQMQSIEATALVLVTAMDQAAGLSATHSEGLARDPAVAALLKAGKRNELQAYAKPVLDRLRNLAGVDVVHFHDPAMKSFLRVWEPGNFGQDLSTFRPMVVAANHDRRTRKGLELGVKGLSLRAVSAIVDGDELAGTVEVGIDLKSLTELSKAATGADYALFLDTSASVSGNGEKSAATGLKIEAATDTKFFETLLGAGHVRLSRAPYLTRADLGGRTIGIMGRPLIDFSGRMIGTILVTRDFTGLESHLTRSQVSVAAVALSGFIIVFCLIIIVLRAFVLRPLQSLAETCRTMPDSAEPPPCPSRLTEFRALYAAVTARMAAGATGREETR